MASVKVAVRVRPFNKREQDLQCKLIIGMDHNKTKISKDKGVEKEFTFDHSYWSFDSSLPHFATQEDIFSDLGTEVVDSAFQGYNACVFAYGQTGSGKTFTMMGSPENPGLIPRICKSLFQRMHVGKEAGASYRTEVSYLEIYNEKVKDLLRGDGTHSLRVREHPTLGPHVQELSTHLVSDYHDIQEWMKRGNVHRTTARTNMNDTSSRSHAIFTVTFVQAEFSAEHPSETLSKVHLVDLAGSERADATGATGERLKEGAHINKSLVTLGLVISTLAKLTSNRSTFIPYRDSVLTWLLKDSLGGNSKTIMIAAISPADVNFEETLSTLRYANRAKNIINKPTINEDPNVTLIRNLREEIQQLKLLLSNQLPEPMVLQQLEIKEAREKELTEVWTEKWRETREILQEQSALGLRKSGVGVVLDSARPHLIGIDDDLLSTGVTFYHLKDGETLIGTEESDTRQDIVISGPGIEHEHCSIVLKDGQAWLHPRPSAQCSVNTVMTDKPVRLSQGCIILLGRTNMFRFNDPAEAAALRKTASRSHLNLSALSLVYSSTTDLAERTFSSDNLNEESKLSPDNKTSGDSSIHLAEKTQDALEMVIAHQSMKVEELVAAVKDLSRKGEHHGEEIGRSRGKPNELEEKMAELEEAKSLLSALRKQLDAKSTIGGNLEYLSESTIAEDTSAGDNSILEPSTPPQNELFHPRLGSSTPPLTLPHKSNNTGHRQSVVSESSEEEIDRPTQRLMRSRPLSKSCRAVCDSAGVADAMRAMKKLCQQVAAQKMLIMQSLESDCSKEDINAQIVELQQLHRQYVRLEAILELRKEGIPSIHAASTRGVARSLPSLRAVSDEEIIWLRIPNFVLRGVGRQSRYEFELRIHTDGETWILLRRYSRFRELHLNMCDKYGSPVSTLEFPPRKWLINTETVARRRRSILENYLLQLIDVCSRIRGCPLYGCRNTPTRQQLLQFSPFFRKGLFETGKYGTT